MFQKKKEPSQQLQVEGEICGSTNLLKVAMPLMTLIRTLSMHGILKYEQYSMSSALIDASIEREVQRSLAGRKEFPFRAFFGMVGLGIMLFMVFLGAYILMQSPAMGGAVAQIPPNMYG